MKTNTALANGSSSIPRGGRAGHVNWRVGKRHHPVGQASLPPSHALTPSVRPSIGATTTKLLSHHH